MPANGAGKYVWGGFWRSGRKGIGFGLVVIWSALLAWVPVCIAFANTKLNFKILRNGLIAEIQNSVKVWVTHTEYTIASMIYPDGYHQA